MGVCQLCSGQHSRPCAHEARTKEYYDILIKPLRYVAYRCGYALAVHGSLSYDIDLIACPWRDSAVNGKYLVEALFKVCEQVIGKEVVSIGTEGPTKKPCGRLGWVIYLVGVGNGPYLDISVMPKGCITEQENKNASLQKRTVGKPK